MTPQRKNTERTGSSVVQTFIKTVWEHYKNHGRDFPWRRTQNPYRILVSEVMLQQTQTDRVVPYYRAFLKNFPSFRALSRANVRDVLHTWQGLGYNRRALYLKKTAEKVTRDYAGRLPRDPAALKRLPGIGDATAGAVCAFAFNKPVPFLETNIRRAYIHFFFPERKTVSDKEILALVEQTLDHKNPREWYFALMDYGAALAQEKTVENPNRRSKAYHKQAPFEGSNRQLRGKVIRLLLAEGELPAATLQSELSVPQKRLETVLEGLAKDGFITRRRSRIALVEK